MAGYYRAGDSVNRLSNLYNDTKRSTDFVIQDQHNQDPEIKALHRKLKIQKDRLVTWGAEWANPDVKADLDEDLSKAGMAEVVGSVMSTIKDILDEAEPMWQSTLQPLEGQTPSARALAAAVASDSKQPIVEFDKTHFENLIHDMTTSIDTLFDLSRARSGVMRFDTTAIDKSQVANDSSSTFESSRLRTPEQIDPTMLIPLNSRRQGSSTSALSLSEGVVLMSGKALATISDDADPSGSPKPLLLQFTPYSALFQHIGGPPLDPIEKLYAALQQRTPGAFANAWSGLPKLLGYFCDEANLRMGLIYQFPQSFYPLRIDGDTRTPTSALHSLSNMLERPDFEPPLEVKFRLAHNIVNTVFDLHARGLTHGAVLDKNVSFASPTASGTSIDQIDARRPLISSFEVFRPWSEEGGMMSVSEDQTNPIYRHPLDPRVTSLSPLLQSNDLRVLDLYPLAVMLLSIGMWTKPENLVVEGAAAIPESVVDQLAIRVGTMYMKAVKTLWGAVDKELTGSKTGKDLLTSVQVGVSMYLQACSALDVSIDSDAGPVPPMIQPPARRTAPRQASKFGTYKGSSVAKQKQLEAFGRIEEEERPPLPIRPTTDSTSLAIPISESALVVTPSVAPKSKLRLYNQVQAPLPKEVVDTWNNVLMHQINQALKQFYRKYTETVEISLESMGPSPSKTKPTVLIVCSSVGKVKAILKRKLGDLFDDDTGMGFGLKVCSGKIVRSQYHGEAGPDDEIPARNGGYQVCPNNGASIGAWNGNRHLPPVSFGGLVKVDDKTYGMTVHHMLDDPDAADIGPTTSSSFADLGADVDTRSSARPKKLKPKRPAAPRYDAITDDASVRRSSGRRKPLPAAYTPQQSTDSASSSCNDKPPPPPPKDPRSSHDIPASLIPGGVGTGGSGVLSGKSVFTSAQQILQDQKQKLEIQIQKQRQHQIELKQKHNQQRAEQQQRTASWTLQASRSADAGEDEEYEEAESDLKRDMAIASADPVLEFSDSETEESVVDSDIDDCMEDSDTESLSLSNWTEEDFKPEPGDIAGIEAGFGDEMVVTQPARDDVDNDFYPCEETADEDHLDTYSLGEVYASSGIRRRTKDGLIHEIDWALFSFRENRLPSINCFPRYTLASQKPPGTAASQVKSIFPKTVASMSHLPGLEVQCMARTSGLQTGQILPSIASVKLAGRRSPSHSFQVTPLPTVRTPRPPPIGLPGDSGAWVIDRREGLVCGHVLAWSQRRQVAYICPMDIMLLDIATTLGAGEVGLLGGVASVKALEGVDEGEEATRRLVAELRELELTGVSEGGNGGTGFRSF